MSVSPRKWVWDQLREVHRKGEVAPPPPVCAYRPEQLGRYLIQRELGRGGTSRVYLAYDPTLKRSVALKVLEGGLHEARVLREARAAARLKHPNIVTVFEVGSQDGRLYLAMELIEGHLLSTAWKEWDVRRRAEAIETVARAIGHAHRQGVVHRDLKPGNVMVTPRGDVKVTDLGLATVEGEQALTRTGSVMGTPAYMAPEQVSSEPADARTDVYALGVMLYEALTDAVPFDGDAHQIMHKIVFEEPRRPRDRAPGVDRDLDTIAMKAMDAIPARRYADADALADELGRWREGDPITARPTSWLGRTSRRIRKNPRLYGVGAVGLAAAVVLCVLLARQEWVRRSEAAAAARAQTRIEEGHRAYVQLLAVIRDPDHSSQDRLAHFEKVKAAFESALAEHPLPGAWLGLGQAYGVMAEPVKALECFEHAVAMDPTFVPARLEWIRIKALAYEDLRHETEGRVVLETAETENQRRELLAALDAVRRHASVNRERLYGEGLMDFADGRYAEAARKLGEYVREVPGDWDGHFCHGHALYHAGDYPAAEAALTKALVCFPRSANIPYQRGLARKAAGDLPGAASDFHHAIRLDSNLFRAFNNLGNTLRAMGNLDAAIEAYRNGLDVNPDDVLALTNLGNTLLAKGVLQEALDQYGEALRRDPSYIDARLNRAAVLLKLKRMDEALQEAQTAVEQQPKSARAQYVRGTALHEMDRFSEALAAYDSALDLDATYVEAWVNRGNALDSLGRSGEAITSYEKALELQPKFERALLNSGRVRLREGDAAGAERDYTRLIEAQPERAGAY